MLCICNLYVVLHDCQKAGNKTKAFLDMVLAEPLSSKKCISDYFTTRTYSAGSKVFFRQMSMCIYLNLDVLILSLDFYLLISIKILQTLTENRIHFYSD